MHAYHRLLIPSAPLLVLLFLSSVRAVDGTSAAEGFRGWTCDELTPDLCDLTVTEGFVPIRDDGLLVKYWKYSSSSSSPSTIPGGEPNDGALPPAPAPVIMVHGGPGMTHNYMLPLKQLACRPDRFGRTRDVYFYDQAGCGESVNPVGSGKDGTNRTTTDMAGLVEDHPYLLDPQYYATIELPRIIEHLGLGSSNENDNDDDSGSSGYHIVANSWGTIVAQYFVLNTDAGGLKSLVLSGPLSDGDLYVESQWSETDTNNLGQLPPFVRDRIHALEDAAAYDSDEYQAINDALTGRFTCRTVPAPDCFAAVWDGINPSVYVGLQGPSEFTLGGVLVGFNTTPGLHTFGDLPVALLSGAYDTMRPPVVDAMYREIPVAEWTIFPHSGHLTMIDDAGQTNDVVDDFLARVEEAAADPDEPPSSFRHRPDLCGPPGCLAKNHDGREANLAGPSTADDDGRGTDPGFSIGAVVWVGILSFFLGGITGKFIHVPGRSADYTSIP